jgi:phosphocarrier protein
MKEKTFTVKTRAGIHCRPASVIINTIKQDFPFCKFEITLDGSTHEINGMLALISLGLAQNTTGVLRVRGDEEEQAIDKICNLLEFEFDFPQNK